VVFGISGELSELFDKFHVPYILESTENWGAYDPTKYFQLASTRFSDLDRETQEACFLHRVATLDDEETTFMIRKPTSRKTMAQTIDHM
jgi:hypothetical protein